MLNATFLRLREDAVPLLREWLDGLAVRSDELFATYDAEGTRHEQFFLLRDGVGPVLVLVTELHDRDSGSRTFLASDMPLAVEFKRIIQQVTDGPAPCELVFDSARLPDAPEDAHGG
ncbi:MAG: DUF6176 family protein [Myxococcota bacterium]|nr:DUF6176 family protein [Myxococcota bacterium]